MSTNLELKVQCQPGDLRRLRDVARTIGESGLLTMRHIDTYFRTSSGRLKLRIIRVAGRQTEAELIGYHRGDTAGPRWSDYTRAPLDPETAESVKAALAATLGILVEVDKERTVCLWRRTRIHLDEVAELGAFVELETVTENDNDHTASVELAEIAGLLGLDAFPVVAGSYSDLMLASVD